MKKILLILTLLIASINYSQQLKPEDIVQKQVEAYNNKNLDTFLSFYSDDIKIYSYPNLLESEGKQAMKTNYANFFSNAKTLNCKIINRIIHNNKIIDQEEVTLNDQKISVITIYEIENNKIVKVTFIY
ncbi:MAG: nuclear transport factor 2 family protein [Limnohabitans sp.]|nr:nuclear transport factor 2 family protein [Limnohabitans sp.]